MSKLAPFVFWQSFDDDGNPLSGGKVYTYDAGTTTNKETYTNSSESAQNANPIILDADGRADIWLASGAYKFIIKDANDVLIDEVDNITGDASNVFGSSVVDISTNTNIVSSYENAVINCTASVTLSLLDAATAEEGFVFTVKNSSSGNVTIDPDGSELIDGNATLTLYPDQSALIDCTGSAWISLYQDVVALPANNLFTGDNTLSGDTSLTGKVLTPNDGELTISTGAVTVTGAYHDIDTEGDAASDDLDTISGGADGQELVIQAAHTDRTVVLKHNTGNILNPTGKDISLDGTTKSVVLKYSGALSKWFITAQPQIVPQVLQTTNSTVQTTTSTTYVDVTSFSRAITPALDSTGVLVGFNVNAFQDGVDSAFSLVQIMRDIDGGGYTSISGDLSLANDRTNASMPLCVSYEMLDTGATAGSVVTYKLQIKTSNASSTLSVHYADRTSTLIVKEVF